MSSKSALSYDLIRLMGQNPDIRTILDTGYKYLNNPIHLTDLTGRLLACSRHDQPVDDIWEGIEHNGYIAHDIYQTTCLPNVLKIFSDPRPMILRDAPGNATLLVCGLKTPRCFHANLIVFQNERLITPEDAELLALVAASLSTVLDSSFLHTGTRKEASDYLICDLLDTPVVNPDMLRERSRIVCLDPKAPLQILTICNSRNITAIPVLNITRTWLEERFFNCKTVIHNNRTVTLLNAKTLDTHFSENGWFSQWLEKYGLTAALSRPFEKLSDIYEHYMQTLCALEYGAILHPDQRFYYYENYSLYRCLDAVSSPETQIHPCIRSLSDYDVEHKTDYVRTLYAYVMQLRSMRDAAAFLNIHYNTMKYRMARILELIDIHPEEPGTFLFLYLSFKIMELKGTVLKGGRSHETESVSEKSWSNL